MTNPQQQDPPPPSGRDLARQALDEYKKRTWAIPGQPPPPAKKKPKRFVRSGDRREPASLADALKGLGVDPAWEAGVAGGSIIDQWPTLCPQYAGLVQPVAYDEKRGRLDLRPGSHSYAAQLRLLGGQLARQINDKLGRPVVRTIRVLPVGTINTSTADGMNDGATPQGPVKTRDDGCPGYQNNRAIVLEHKPEPPPVDPYVAEAMVRQEAALRASRQAEGEHREAVWAEADVSSGPAPGSVEESLARARAYARQTRAGRAPRQAFDLA
jgi:hypothetical protein